MTNEVYVDGIPATTYLREIIARHRVGALNREDLFWSTSPQGAYDPCREIFQVEFAGPRPVNHISFKAARFPHHMTAEWWDPATDQWRPLRQQIGRIATIDPAYDVAEQRAAWEGPEVYSEVLDSVPRVINQPFRNTDFYATHPQHYGAGHWVQVKWKVVPVNAKAIRVILVRHEKGLHPVGPDGRNANYSLAVKDFSAGFRIYSRDDVPASGRVTLEEFGSSLDLMGTPITYRLKEYAPRHVLGGVLGQYWKSEPQPVNYAVVNFYADVREPDGSPQTIDRFYIDPLTVGPSLSLYYTNDEPDSDFEADDSPLAFPLAQVHGDALEMESDPLGNAYEAITYSDTGSAFTDVDNAFLQWDPQRPWWLGMSVRTADLEGTHPLASFGGNTLRIREGLVEFVTDDGMNATVEVPGAIISDNLTTLNIAVVWTPFGSESEVYQPGTISILVGSPLLPGDPASVSVQVLTTSLGEERPEVFSVGRYPVFETPGVPAFSLLGLTLKVDEAPSVGMLHGFVSEPDLFVLKPDYAQAPDFTLNSLLRMHPTFATPSNVSGSVGGPGDRYEDATWTPVARDYTLRQGFLRFPPTRARHFKFEFTNLVHETYESLVPIRREVRVFPASVVAEHEMRWIDPIDNRYITGVGDPYSQSQDSAVGHDYSDAPGTRTMIENDDLAQYSDALRVMEQHYKAAMEGNPSATEGYVARDPVSQEKLAELGWVWSYTPWHMGSTAPRWTLTQKHSYEKITVNHETKTAFFVGIRRLDAYRVDYMTDDDTDIYYEQFLDQVNVQAFDGIIFTERGMEAINSGSSFTSQVFPSTRMVRGIQFATVQSDNIAMLPDDGFIAEDLSEHWAIYGDATLTRVPGQGVRVNRGWYQRTYGQIEHEFPTYEDLETQTYGQLEGATSFGVAGGGIESERVAPSQAGRIYAAARVTAIGAMDGPVRLEIVSVDTGDVLASVTKSLTLGETATLTVGYGVGTAAEITTYGDLEEFTYGDLEGQRYGDIQTSPIEGAVYARLWQTNPSTNEFLVRRLSLFDAPISWQFSVDGGSTWVDPMDIRNNPEGVLTFPEPGNALVWKATFWHPAAEISAMSVRPWYGGLLGSVLRGATDFTGPNRSVIDDYPEVEDDPLWKQSDDPIPSWWYTRDVASVFGRPPSVLSDGQIVVPDPTIEPPADPLE